MAQITNTRIKIEPTDDGRALEYGPSDYYSHNAVMITSESLERLGANAPMARGYWTATLWVYDDIDGVPTLRDMTGYSFVMTVYDPLTRAVQSAGIVIDLSEEKAGAISVSIEKHLSAAGMYRFDIVSSVAEARDEMLCGGWIEVIPSTPSA